MTKAHPQRTCVGCRAVVPVIDVPATVVRVVVDGAGRAVLDEGRRLPGRGAWVHRTRPCLEAAVRGGLARSFRRKVDPKGLISYVESGLATASEKS
jgi:predicted RNA-binding protein YlxR (DUF448 family)